MGGVEFANLPEREQVRVLHRIGGRSFCVGATYLLGQLAAELGLTAALNQVFANDLDLKLLSLAFFRVLCPTEQWNSCADNAEDTLLPCACT